MASVGATSVQYKIIYLKTCSHSKMCNVNKFIVLPPIKKISIPLNKKRQPNKARKIGLFNFLIYYYPGLDYKPHKNFKLYRGMKNRILHSSISVCCADEWVAKNVCSTIIIQCISIMCRTMYMGKFLYQKETHTNFSLTLNEFSNFSNNYIVLKIIKKKFPFIFCLQKNHKILHNTF